MSPISSSSSLRLGTRGSLLARAQSEMIAEALRRRHPGLRVELAIRQTSGDRILDRPLYEFGGKGLFTKELEQALLAGEIDLAVHSLKDVPVTMPLVAQENLVIAAVPPREDPRDALVSSLHKRLMDLPAKARVGTSSLRRQCQILALRPDLRIEPVRGNLDTRLRKQRDGEFDAIILAMAGLHRSGLYRPEEMTPLEYEQVLPAAGQGALALQCRRDDPRTRELLSALHDPITALCVHAERAVVAGLQGDCHSPIAALGIMHGDQFTLRAAVGAHGGVPPVLAARAIAPMSKPESAVASVLVELEKKGARELLARPVI
jgi:hydroxymethylbilane synthase